jgi:uncharacterized membrane protein
MSSSTAPAEVRAGSGRGDIARLALAAAGLAVFQLISHVTLFSSEVPAIAVLAPLVLPGLLLMWTTSYRGRCALLLAACALAGVAAAALTSHAVADLLPLAGQLALCLPVAWLFGRTLMPGEQPLVTRVSRAVHGSLPPAMEAYTRNVTAAWAAFLFGLCIVSVLLFVLAPREVWSVFANLLLLPLVGCMFVAEHAYRTRRHPWFAHATLAQSVAAFQRQRAVRTLGDTQAE